VEYSSVKMGTTIQCCGSGIFLSRIRLFSITDPGSEFFPSGSNNLSILTQKMVSKLLEIFSGLFIPDAGSFFTHPRSRIQGSKRHRIPGPGSGSATLPSFN
jgi:hypothetical protein